MSKPTHVCVQCHSEMKPKRFMPGSILIEIILWCFFFIPGIIYSLWRHSATYKICPECESRNFVSLTSQHGKKLAYGSVSTGA